MQVEVPLLSQDELLQGNPANTPSSADIRQRVELAQTLQHQRQGKLNGQLQASEVDDYCVLSNTAKDLLTQALERFNLSARSYHRILKVCRTIADLEQSPSIEQKHISEALNYRKMERYLSQLP